MGSLIVLGVGNALFGDDAVGVRAAQLLGNHPDLPADTVVIDGGTAGLSLLPLISDARALVLIDAVEIGAPPGKIQVLTGRDLHAAPARLSIHEVGASDLLAAARLTGNLPEHTALVGIQPADLTPGLELSPAVAAALPELVETVVDWCQRFN